MADRSRRGQGLDRNQSCRLIHPIPAKDPTPCRRRCRRGWNGCSVTSGR